MIFAASFFGAFEITMPSWLVNKSDSKADKGGIVGVFFHGTDPRAGIVLMHRADSRFGADQVHLGRSMGACDHHVAFSAAFDYRSRFLHSFRRC